MSWVLRVTLGFLVILGLSWAAAGTVAQQCVNGQCQNGKCQNSQAAPRYGIAAPSYQAAARPQVDHPAVCEIKVLDRDGMMSVGTGTLVAIDGLYGVVVSCEHVFRDMAFPGRVDVRFPNGEWFRSQAKHVTTDSAKELSACRISAPVAVHPVELAVDDAEPGEMVKAVGRGRVIAGRVLPPEDGWMVVSGQAVGGDSGGPILNAAGKLLGVLWGSNRNEIHGSSTNRLRAFLCDPRRKVLPWNAAGSPCPCDPSSPAQPIPPVEPEQPQVTPPACDLTAIQAELAELRVLILGIERGPQGEPGPPGADGAKGEPGADGVSPTLDYKAIAAEVTPLLPPLDGMTFIVQHSDGTTETATAHLGDTVLLWRDTAGNSGVDIASP